MLTYTTTYAAPSVVSRPAPRKKFLIFRDILKAKKTKGPCRTAISSFAILREMNLREDGIYMAEKTLSIIKPDGVRKNVIGDIIKRFESNGLKVAAMKMVHLSRKEAEGFYAVHSARPFFASLTEFMSSGPVVLMVLKGEGAVLKSRGR